MRCNYSTLYRLLTTSILQWYAMYRNIVSIRARQSMVIKIRNINSRIFGLQVRIGVTKLSANARMPGGKKKEEVCVLGHGASANNGRS